MGVSRQGREQPHAAADHGSLVHPNTRCSSTRKKGIETPIIFSANDAFVMPRYNYGFSKQGEINRHCSESYQA